MKKIILFIFCCAFFILLSPVEAAQLFFRSDKPSYKTGETGLATLNINTERKAINAIGATISYDPSLIEITKISLDRSIINFWPQSAAINPEAGEITFKGIIFNPAYNGALGRLIGVEFKAIAPGSLNFRAVNFSVLANDGKGTAISTKGVSKAIAIIGAAQSNSFITITSATHPNQKQWYNKSALSLAWSTSKKELTSLAYALDRNAKTQPSEKLITNFKSAAVRDLANGVWYAHVRGRDAKGAWYATEHFKINIDTQPPESNTIIVLPRQGEFVLPTIRAQAKDSLSGVKQYEIIVNGKLFTKQTVAANVKLKNLLTGKNIVEIKAYDNAGNVRSDKITVLYNPLAQRTAPQPTTPKQSVPTPVAPVTPKVKAPVQFD